MPTNPTHVFWLFGLSGAGKSTLAGGLADGLRRSGSAVLALDGDRLRQGLCAGLGFDDAARDENLRRAAEVAKLAVESGITVVAAFITPREAQRAKIREIIGPRSVSLIHIAAPLEVCAQRDVKGLYSRARADGIAQFTGVSAPFETPAEADLVVPTEEASLEECTTRLLAYALSRGKL